MVDHKDFSPRFLENIVYGDLRVNDISRWNRPLRSWAKAGMDEGSRTLDSLGSIWSFDGDSYSGEVTTKGIKAAWLGEASGGFGRRRWGYRKDIDFRHEGGRPQDLVKCGVLPLKTLHSREAMNPR